MDDFGKKRVAKSANDLYESVKNYVDLIKSPEEHLVGKFSKWFSKWFDRTEYTFQECIKDTGLAHPLFADAFLASCGAIRET